MSQIFVLKTLSGELRGTLLFLNGGDSRARTYDTLVNSQLLYLLSYAPKYPSIVFPAWEKLVLLTILQNRPRNKVLLGFTYLAIP